MSHVLITDKVTLTYIKAKVDQSELAFCVLIDDEPKCLITCLEVSRSYDDKMWQTDSRQTSSDGYIYVLVAKVVSPKPKNATEHA